MMTLRIAVGMVASLLSLISCTPPGEGPKALAGFKGAASILQGLGEYHSKNAVYPDRLELLAPVFLAPSQLTPPADVARYEYARKGPGFTFGFNYHGPGTNTCTFDSASRSWECHGHF